MPTHRPKNARTLEPHRRWVSSLRIGIAALLLAGGCGGAASVGLANAPGGSRPPEAEWSSEDVVANGGRSCPNGGDRGPLPNRLCVTNTSTPLRPVDADPTGTLPACVTVATSAPYRIGYDHVVTIENGCRTEADCTVSTDVSPAPITAVVPPRTSVDVVTWRGSPSRQFRADVTCKLDP